MHDNLCAEMEDNIIIQTTVPLLSAKDELSNIVRKTVTMSMLEEEYPLELWARVYTDGSATNVTSKGGTGIYINYPNGAQQSVAIPTRLHCSKYKAEEEALIHAENSIKENVAKMKVLFLIDAFSAIQALNNNKLSQLEITFYSIKTI